MRIFDKQNRSLIALLLVFLLIILVYGATSALTLDEEAPEKCNETYFSISDACLDMSSSAYNGFMPALELSIENSGQAINGFRVRVFGTKGAEPIVVFKTVSPMASGMVAVPFKQGIVGDIRRIEIEPLLNVNHDIIYCGLRHGTVYEGAIREC